MEVSIKELDRTRIYFEAAIKEIGEKKARVAFKRGLNKEGNKIRTTIKKELVKQTGLKSGMVKSRMSSTPAKTSTLTYRIGGSGRHFTLAQFSPKQFGAGKRGGKGLKGVKASPWGRRQFFEDTFIVRKLNGVVFRR